MSDDKIPIPALCERDAKQILANNGVTLEKTFLGFGSKLASKQENGIDHAVDQFNQDSGFLVQDRCKGPLAGFAGEKWDEAHLLEAARNLADTGTSITAKTLVDAPATLGKAVIDAGNDTMKTAQKGTTEAIRRRVERPEGTQR